MRRHKQPRAFTMVEVMVALSVVIVAIVVMVSSFSMQLRHSTKTRAGLMASLVMESLVEEVRDHPYGDPAPASWSEPVSFAWVVEGRRVENKFMRKVEIASKRGNGSFFGKALGNSDVLRLEVSWSEASGLAASQETKSIAAELTVVAEI